MQQAEAVGCCTSFSGLISMLLFDILRIRSGFFQNYSECFASLAPPGYGPAGIQFFPMKSRYFPTVIVTINFPRNLCAMDLFIL